MTDKVSNQIVITVPSDMLLEACVRQIVGYGEMDDDYEGEGDRFSRAMRKRIDDAIAVRIDDALERVLDEEIRSKVTPIIDAVCAKGFPVFDGYGKRLRTEEWEGYVHQAIDALFTKSSGYGQTPEVVKLAKEAFDQNVRKAFKAETDLVRKKVREYVDEQLAGTVVKGLREAVGLR